MTSPRPSFAERRNLTDEELNYAQRSKMKLCIPYSQTEVETTRRTGRRQVQMKMFSGGKCFQKGSKLRSSPNRWCDLSETSRVDNAMAWSVSPDWRQSVKWDSVLTTPGKFIWSVWIPGDHLLTRVTWNYSHTIKNSVMLQVRGKKPVCWT